MSGAAKFTSEIEVEALVPSVVKVARLGTWTSHGTRDASFICSASH